MCVNNSEFCHFEAITCRTSKFSTKFCPIFDQMKNLQKFNFPKGPEKYKNLRIYESFGLIFEVSGHLTEIDQ